jgi:hypothetical protein
VYGVVGVTFAVPAHGSAFQVRAWRLAAWLVSGVVFPAHMGYAHWRLRTSPVPTALQASLGAALGTFLLAVAATVRVYLAGAGNLPAFRLALVVWPVITVVPAFVVALVVAAQLTFPWRGGESGSPRSSK